MQKWLGLACETRIDITIKGLKFVCWVGQGLTRSDPATSAKRKGFYELCIQAVSHWNARQHPYILRGLHENDLLMGQYVNSLCLIPYVCLPDVR